MKNLATNISILLWCEKYVSHSLCKPFTQTFHSVMFMLIQTALAIEPICPPYSEGVVTKEQAEDREITRLNFCIPAKT